MAVLGRTAARAKVASLLLMLKSGSSLNMCARQTPTIASPLELPLSRSEMANCLGLTVDTVSRQFTHLKNDGTIAIISSRRLTVLDTDPLEETAHYYAA